MTPIIPARLRAFRTENDAVAPNRRTTSDGWYANKPGDHNVDYRGVVHADDTGQSMPGSPYWFNGINPRNGRPYDKLDVFAGARAVVAHYRSLTPTLRRTRWRWLYDGGYMVWWEASRGYEAIFGPTVSLDIRPNGGRRRIGHVEHLHRSIAHTIAAENDTLRFFIGTGEDDDMTPEEFQKIMVGADGKSGYRELWKSDVNAVVKARLDDTVPDLVEAAVKRYVEDKLGGYVNGSWKPDALADKVLPEARKKYGLSSS